MTRRRYYNPEKLKAHAELPDFLRIGVHEERNADGELLIFLRGSRLEKNSAWIVIGKYAVPNKDGMEYYVADRTATHWADIPVTTYHDHLLMAVARVHEIRTAFNARHNIQDHDHDTEEMDD